MADAKLTQLTEDTTPSTTGLVYYVDDPLGSPASRKATISNLFSSGTYTPTLGNVTNVAASSVQQAFQYIRIGSIVYVSGPVTQDATTAATQTILSITLPFASNFGTTHDAVGVATSQTSGEYGGAILSNSTSDFVILQTYPISNANIGWRVSFMYTII